MQLRVVTVRPFNASTPLAALAHDLTPPRLHYVRDHFPRPDSPDAERWRLRVGGLVSRPRELSLADLRRMPERTLVVTIECAGNARTRMRPVPPGTPWDDGAVSTQRWTGTPLAEALAQVGVATDAVEVLFRGADRDAAKSPPVYERSLPLAVALHPDTLLASALDGGPVPASLGGPLRLVVPGWYGMASVKWLDAVEVLDRPFEGYYQTNDYRYTERRDGAPDGPVERMRVKSVLHTPTDGAEVAVDEETRVEGRAWCGEAEVRRVEVSTDGGATWKDADLDPPLGPYAWRRFTIPWTPAEAGEHVLVARATDADGRTQPLEPPWNARGYGNNAVVPVRVLAR